MQEFLGGFLFGIVLGTTLIATGLVNGSLEEAAVERDMYRLLDEARPMLVYLENGMYFTCDGAPIYLEPSQVKKTGSIC